MKTDQQRYLSIAGLGQTTRPFLERTDGACSISIEVQNEKTGHRRTTTIGLSKRDLAGLAFEILYELRQHSGAASEAAYQAGRLHAQLLDEEKAQEASKKAEGVAA